MSLTSDILRSICTTLPIERTGILATLHNEICPKYSINSSKRLQMFLANCIHESAEFTKKTENLNYSVNGLMGTFSFYKKNPELAAKHGRTDKHPADQQAIANTVYDDANRGASNKVGNINPGDGWLFRGGGFIQMTGRDMYTKYAKAVGTDVKQVAELVRSDDRWALDSACWIFSVEKKLLEASDAGNIEAVTKSINGGLNGFDERKKYYALAKKVLL